MTRSISRSRPITGSRRPSAASLVRLRPYCSRTEPSSPCCCGPGPPKPAIRTSAVAGWAPSEDFEASSFTALRTASAETPIWRRASIARPLPSDTMPSSRCSVEMYICPWVIVSRYAPSSTRFARGVKGMWPPGTGSVSLGVRSRTVESASS